VTFRPTAASSICLGSEFQGGFEAHVEEPRQVQRAASKGDLAQPPELEGPRHPAPLSKPILNPNYPAEWLQDESGWNALFWALGPTFGPHGDTPER